MTSTIFWLVLGLVGLDIVRVAGAGTAGHDLAVMLPSFGLMLWRVTTSPIERDRPPSGVSLATAGQTRRRTLGQGAVTAAGFALMAVPLGLGLRGVAVTVAVLGFALAIHELIFTLRVIGWERDNPGLFVAEELSWLHAERFAWSTRWGDRTPLV